MMKIVAILLLSLCSARAQIGWTLEQCRKHFGHEIQADGSPWFHGPTARTFGIKYRPHDEYNRGFDGRLLFVDFDPDGTVGKIKWWKWGSEFSVEEIKKLLKMASNVTWVPMFADNVWVGEQYGQWIFDAGESDTGTGGWMLDITTR
jgi:hypothetical protein